MIAAFACLPAAARPADGVDKGDSTTMLDRVVISAEKQGRSQHDTATSTDVLTKEDLDRRGLTDRRSVFSSTANVVNLGLNNAAPAIRGIEGSGAAVGIDAFFAGSRPRLDITFDGRPLSFNETTLGDNGLWDVDQVELLRGAQSLLQGRNAIAGTLAIKSNDPTFDTEGGAMVSAGNHDRYEGAFYFSAPIVADQLAFRVSADTQHHNSFLNYESFGSVKNPGRIDNDNFRAKLLFTPKGLPDFREVLTLQHADSIAPHGEITWAPYTSKWATYPQYPVVATRSNALISDSDWQFGDRLKFHNLLTATALNMDRWAAASAGGGNAHVETKQYTLEPNLVLDRGDTAFSGIAGAYLFKSDQHEFIDIPASDRFHDHIDTEAVYAQGTLALNDQLDLTAGARYERENHRRAGGDDYGYIDINLDKTWSTFLHKLDLAWHPNAAWTFGVLAQRGYTAGGGGAVRNPATGGYDIYSYDPEYVRDYEAYFRGDLADGKLQLTGNLFYGDYDGLQLLFVVDPNPSSYSAVIHNVDRAWNAGAELGARWLASEHIDLHASLGVLRTRIASDPDWGTQGNEFADAPKFTGSLGVGWHDASGFEFNLDLHRTASYFSDVQNYVDARIDPYWMGRLKVGYHIGHAYLFASVDNLFDHRDPLWIYELSPALASYGYNTGTMPEPRNWQAGVRFDFR